MTQRKSTISNNNQAIRTYELEGVQTPASGLDEYFYLDFSNLPSLGNTVTIDLEDTVTFDLKSLFIDTRDTNTGRSMAFSDADGLIWQFTIDIPDGAASVESPPPTPIIVPANKGLTITNTNTDLKSIRFLARRAAVLSEKKVI